MKMDTEQITWILQCLTMMAGIAFFWCGAVWFLRDIELRYRQDLRQVLDEDEKELREQRQRPEQYRREVGENYDPQEWWKDKWRD